jgi:zinc transport system substrate-binding protein
MNKILLALIVVFVVLGIGLFVVNNNRYGQNDKKVAATIFPLYDIVKNIAGDEIDVVLVLPAGASPHTFDLTPRKAKTLSGSQAVFKIGYGLDDWISQLVTSGEIGKAVVVDKYVNLHEFSGEEHEHDHADGVDPHYWLSVPNALLIAQQIQEELSKIYPEKSLVFTNNYNDYKEQLELLDSEIKQEFNSLSSRNIATFHNAWNYFSDEYGLNVVATFEEFPGEEPTAEYLKSFQNQISSKRIKAVFAEPQFSARPLEPIADDLGFEISILDPLGGVEERKSFLSLMRYNKKSVVDSLK